MPWWKTESVPEIVPEPGLVIPYLYLWRHQHEAGEESGRKTRPCVVVVVVTRPATGRVRVACAALLNFRPALGHTSVWAP
jgi:hypothetical protein